MPPIKQTAPDPIALRKLVASVTYKDGWWFELIDDLDRGQGSEGMTLLIRIETPDSYNSELKILVNHYMIVPAASFNEASWKRWLFEQVLLVEQHEASEFFKIDGSRPYAPIHAPGHDPYTIRETAKLEDAQLDHRGMLRHEEV